MSDDDLKTLTKVLKAQKPTSIERVGDASTSDWFIFTSRELLQVCQEAAKYRKAKGKVS